MTRRSLANRDVGTLQGKQEDLVRALQMLFDLLEEYAPAWYTQEHHDIATDALASARKSSKAQSSVHRRRKEAA